jgi:hypothetical protein
MEIKADSVDSLPAEGLGIPLLRVNNLKIKNEGSESIYVDDKVFLFQFDFYFFHQIHEIVGQFEVLKRLVPDLKIVFVQQNVQTPSQHGNEDFFTALSDIGYGNIDEITKGADTHKYFSGLVGLYKDQALNENVYNLKVGQYFFKEAYLFFDAGIPLFKDLFKTHNHSPYWEAEDYMKVYLDKTHSYYSWHLEGMAGYRDLINKNINFDDSLPKKIYLSRKDIKARYKKLLSTVVDEPSLKFFKSRTFDEGDFLEPYFEEKGYTCLTFQGMPLIKQLTYIKNATHIAGVIGSGFTNLIACRSGANIYEIHVNSDYGMDYSYLCNLSESTFHRVLLQECNEDHKEMKKRLDDAGV